MIRAIDKSDIPSICRIYNYYIKNTIITFEEEEIDNTEMEKRITETTGEFPWLVFEENGTIAGYAYAAKWKRRSAYRYSAESTIYLHPERLGKGIGYKLYSHLLTEIKKKDIHSLIGGIALPNKGSIALHEKLGFKKCAHFKEVGKKFGQWVDVGYWEKIL